MTLKAAELAESPIVSSDSPLSSALDSDEFEQSEFAISQEPATLPDASDQASTKRAASQRKVKSGAAPEGRGPAKPRRRTREAADAQVQISQERNGDTTRSRRGKKITRNGEDQPAVRIEVEAECSAEVVAEAVSRTPRKSRKRAAAKLESQQEQEDQEEHEDEGVSKKPKRRKKKEKGEEDPDSPQQPKRRRKTKEEREAEAMPIASRSVGLKMFIGAHVSSAKGVHNSITNSVHVGGNAFALFLKSQRKWENPDLKPEHAVQFKSFCDDHKYDSANHVLPHGSYLVNLAQPDPARAKQAYDCFLDDLQRCETLGIRLYNFHPGWRGPHPREEGIARIASAINRAHRETSSVTPLLETMAGSDSVIGSRFEDLRDIISQVHDKSRIGVCLDTCHVFAAGYDLRTPAAFRNTMTQFDDIIGLRYLSALHINDSKAPFSSHRDLHQNVGLGFLGLRAFHNVMNDRRLEGLPLVLETPIDRDGKEDKGIWAAEIKLLESMIGMDPDSPEFLAKEKELADQGAQERIKLQEAYDRKVEKEKKKAEGGTRRKRTKKESSASSSNNNSDDESS